MERSAAVLEKNDGQDFKECYCCQEGYIDSISGCDSELFILYFVNLVAIINK